MTVESIPIPAERVPPIAKETSSNSKLIAGLLGVVCLLMFVAALSSIAEDTPPRHGMDSAEASGYRAGQVIGFALIVGLPALFAMRAGRNASRATRAAAVATSDTKYTFQVSGKYI